MVYVLLLSTVILFLQEAAKRSHVLYDRKGDEHYFMASALQKSIRGEVLGCIMYISFGLEDSLFKYPPSSQGTIFL